MAARTYLDWNASAPLRAEARAALSRGAATDREPVLGPWRRARGARSWSRMRAAHVAALVGADARNVIFTSGGTEANALALTPRARVRASRRPFDRLLVSAIEHPSVLAGGRFAPSAVEKIAGRCRMA